MVTNASGVTRDFDSSATHVRAQVHADAAVDFELSATHTLAEQFDPMQVAVHFDMVTVFTCDLKEVVQPTMSLAVIHQTAADLFV